MPSVEYFKCFVQDREAATKKKKKQRRLSASNGCHGDEKNENGCHGDDDCELVESSRRRDEDRRNSSGHGRLPPISPRQSSRHIDDEDQDEPALESYRRLTEDEQEQLGLNGRHQPNGKLAPIGQLEPLNAGTVVK